MKKIFIIFVLLMSCSTKYTRLRKPEIVSEDERHLMYKIKDKSLPSEDSPYLIYTLEEQISVEKKYMESFRVKTDPNILTYSPILGIIPGILYWSSGYVALGRIIVGGSIPLTFLFHKTAKSSKVKDIIKTEKDTILQTPSGIKFSVSLKEEKTLFDYLCDENGELKIAMTDFASSYNREKYFNFSVTSPEGEKIDEVSIPTEPVHALLIKHRGVDVDLAIPKTGLSSENAVAVVIGIKDYSNPGIPAAEYAINDAYVMKEYLIDVLGFKEENIIHLENPTKGDFEKVFGSATEPRGQLYNWVTPEVSDIFVYFSGHGAPDKEDKRAYLLLSEADPFYIRVSGYSLDLLFENINRIPAKEKTIVIEACFSGNYQKGSIGDLSSVVGVRPIVKKHENMNIFTAGNVDEVAGWYPEKRHGLFTYYFLKGLRGEADLNDNGEITYLEMKEYIKENVLPFAKKHHGREQNPVFNGKEKEVLVKW